MFFNPVHEFPRPTIFVGNFLNFVVEKIVLCLFSTLELSLIFNLSGLLIGFKISTAVFVPLLF